jgi:histidinol-phosphate aminotransferase
MSAMAPRFVRPHVRALDGPAREPPPVAGERLIKLNSNENPFPPSPKVLQAIQNIEPELLRRYPDPSARAFREAAAPVLGVGPEMILAGNGADDLLAIAARTFIASGGTLASPLPTYALFPVLAQLSDAKFVPVEWEKNWSLPADALLASKPDAIFLANPNTPSATFVQPSRLAELAGAFSGLLLIDETYVDFADANCLDLVREFPNVVVVRSMSVGYSLAGLRFGFAVGQVEVIEEMNKARDPFNCDAVAIAGAAAAIEDQEYASRTWQQVRAERQRLAVELEQLGWSVLPSQANFILATCPDGRGRDAYLGLKEQGILVRHSDKPPLADKIRISIGTSQENNALLGGIKALATAEKAA